MLQSMLVLFCLAAPAPPDAPMKPGVVVHAVGPSDKVPDLAWRIIVSPRGDLRGIMSHPIRDEDLKKQMRATAKKRRVLIEVKASVEKDTSITTYIEAVERIKRCADPEAETVIYLHFQSLTGPKR